MKRPIRITSMLLAIVMAVSFTACNERTAVSRTDSSATDTTISSNVDSTEVSSDTETSKEETSSDTSSSKSEISSDTDSSESSATTTAVTTTTNKTTTTNSTSSPKEEKTEEREVYDEDGNVVDKIKVKVVDGVAYTVGEKSDDKCILDGVPLYTNDPEFPSGDIITMVQTALYMNGQEITQKEIFEKYVEYHTPDEWYEEDGIKCGPVLCEEKLMQDPRLKPTDYFNGGLGNLRYYCNKILEENSVEVIEYSSELYDIADDYEKVKFLVDGNHLPFVYSNYNTKNIWEWVNDDMEIQGFLDGERVFLSIGYFSGKFVMYDVKSDKIIDMWCFVDGLYSI